jgi:quercetin dioxygenase-like cupin family protein
MTRMKLVAALLASLLIAPALAQDATRVQPTSYRLVLDNPQVRVMEYDSRPGMGICGTGVHSHPAHLTVLLTPARVRVMENGHSMMVDQKAGDVFWSPPVTHEVENLGIGPVRALIIELKTPAGARG